MGWVIGWVGVGLEWAGLGQVEFDRTGFGVGVGCVWIGSSWSQNCPGTNCKNEDLQHTPHKHTNNKGPHRISTMMLPVLLTSEPPPVPSVDSNDELEPVLILPR